MSVTLASVPVPLLQHNYQGKLPEHRPETNPSVSASRLTFEIAQASHLVTPYRSARWSHESDSSESLAEEKQMSSHGDASGPQSSQSNTFQPVNASRSDVPDTRRASGPDSRMATREGSPTTALHDKPAAQMRESEDLPRPRLSGVHSILNPSPSHEDEVRLPRRRAASEMEGGASERPLHLPRVRDHAGGNEGPANISPPFTGGTKVLNPRRILTPISPRIQRHASFNRVTGTISAINQPFLSDVSRISTPDYASSNTNPQPAQSHISQVPQRSPFIVPAAPTPPLAPGPRRASVSVVGSTIGSARPSPSPSYADSYSQGGISGQTSPAMQPVPGGPPGPTPARSLRSPSIGQLSNVPPGSLENEQEFHNDPVVSSGQNYQMLTVDTSQGHMQMPVEVQAASRMADEKRKRNAGASARFRARRKEKEREAAGKISNLELELQFAQEDARFYKAERDHLVNAILSNVPHYDNIVKNRPPSPRHKRVYTTVQRSSMDSPLSTVSSELYESEDRPTTRRKTADAAYPVSARPVPPQYMPPSYHQNTPPSLPPLQHPSLQYAQLAYNASGTLPPPLARPHPAYESTRQDQQYDRSWPPRTQ